jgi:ATP-dependent helicase/nuclease subunit B
VEHTLSIFVCANPQAEAEMAAHEILRQVREDGGRFRDCAVILRRWEGYHDVLRRVFRRYEIPFFMDRREPVAHHPAAELTRYALRTVTYGWRIEDWFGALKTGLVPANEAEVDELENAALAHGWNGATWFRPLQMPDEPQWKQDQVEALRQRLIPPFQRLNDLLAASSQRPTGRHLADAIQAFWLDLDVGRQLQAWSEMASQALAPRPSHLPPLSSPLALHATVWDQLNAWLDNVALAFGDESLPLRDWLPVLESGLAELTAGTIPPALDQVLIGTVDRSRNPDLQLALVLGLNESVFPAPPPSSGLLSESDREELEHKGVALGPNRRAQLGHERYLGYIALTRPRRRLVAGFSRLDADDRALNPSPFIEHLKRLFPGLQPKSWTPPADWLSSMHASELAPSLLRALRAEAKSAGQEGNGQVPMARVGFPLTPALSPGERESLIQPRATWTHETRRDTECRTPSPGGETCADAECRTPSPGGEGRGEGEHGPVVRAEHVAALLDLADLPALADVRERLAALAAYAPDARLSAGLARRLYTEVLRTSVSAVEKFAACPFQFFIHAGLRAEERKVFEVDQRERGSFQHEVLARFHQRACESHGRWRELTPADARRLVGEVAEEVIRDYNRGLFQADPQSRFAARALTGALQDFIEVAVGWLASNQFDPTAVEVGFGFKDSRLPAWEIDLGDGCRMAFRGRIDRVDLAPDPEGGGALCVVLDYKSGQRRIDPLLLEHGIQIQLPAYLAALSQMSDPSSVLGAARLAPAGMFYVNLRGAYESGSSRSDVLADPATVRRQAYKHVGRFSLHALPRLDTLSRQDGSGQFSYALKRDGFPSRTHKDLVSQAEFEELLAGVQAVLREMGQRIFAGEAEVDPYRHGSATACDRCQCPSICRIDPWTHPYRALTEGASATPKPTPLEAPPCA